MGLLDKLTGTRAGSAGVEPAPVAELRAALLRLSRDTAPWHVREGAADDKCDLVAEWRIVDAQWSGIFAGSSLSSSFRILLKFHEAEHEVRNVDEQTTVSFDGGTATLSKSWSRGQIHESEYGEGYAYTETDQLGQVYNYKFHSNEIRDPLRDVVTDHGWGWKAVTFRL